MTEELNISLQKNYLIRLKAEQENALLRNKLKQTNVELQMLKNKCSQDEKETNHNLDILNKMSLITQQVDCEKNILYEMLAQLQIENTNLREEIGFIKKKTILTLDEIHGLKSDRQNIISTINACFLKNMDQIKNLSAQINSMNSQFNHFQNEFKQKKVQNENIKNEGVSENEVEDSEETFSPICISTEQGQDLWDAIYKGSLPGVKYWLALNPEYLNKEGDKKYLRDTPLQLAAYEGHYEIVRFLVEKGALIEIRHPFELNTALHLATIMGHTDIVKYLVLNGAKIELKNKNNMRCIHFACRKGYLEIVEFLISKNCELTSCRLFDSATPIHLAAMKGHLRIVQCLVEYGVDLEEKDKILNTPLHLASFRGRLDVVKYLLSKGAELEVKRGIDHNTPLHLACIKGHIEIVQYLIEKGADKMALNTNNNTPLHLAAFNGRMEVVQFLISQRVNANFKNAHEETPIDIALYKNHTHIINYLSTVC